MQFTVPQFIERETRIVGPLSFRQFLFIGFAGAICFVLYFLAPFRFFLIGCFVLGGGAIALAFFKIEGFNLPTVLMNFLTFGFSSKMYLWHRKPSRIIIKKQVRKKEIIEETPPLKVAGESQLRKLSTRIETKL